MSKSSTKTRRKPRNRSKGNKQAVIHSANQSNIPPSRPLRNYLPQASKQSTPPMIKVTIPPLDGTVPKRKRVDWKPIVQKYISLYNQAETDQNWDRLSVVYQDSIHNERVTERLERLKNRDLLRGVYAGGSETKAEIVKVNELENEVIVHLKLHIRRKMIQDGKQYTEERYDQERIWLIRDQEEWIIHKIEPILVERKPRVGGAIMDWNPNDEVEKAERSQKIAVPYLNQELLPNFKRAKQENRYRRDLAVSYADLWWNKANPQYEEFDSNCTNYVSQCIFAGDVPMLYTNRRDNGWWYKGRQQGKEWWSYSWAVSKSLASFLMKSRKQGLQAVEVSQASDLELGDVIVYDWNGDTRYQHTTIVTAFDAKGQPLVNANTTASRHRYWDYQDSYAWTPYTQYRFFHITDYV